MWGVPSDFGNYGILYIIPQYADAKSSKYGWCYKIIASDRFQGWSKHLMVGYLYNMSISDVETIYFSGWTDETGSVL